MRIHINNDRINTIKRVAKKYILVTSVSLIILSTPITKTKAQMYDNNYDTAVEYLEISDDKDFLYVENSTNLSIIKTLESLTEISLYNCNIDSSLEGSKISTLTLKDCSFSTSTPRLPHTITELEIDNTTFNFNILKSLTNLEKISFKNIEFDSLEALEGLTEIKQLKFDSCNIGTLKGIQDLTSIKNLSFVDTGIESIEELKNLHNLTNLTLEHTYVSDISPIEDSNISVLNITDSTNIKNLDTIIKMKKLTNLTATNCEMAYTQEILDYIYLNNIYSNITQEGLDIKNKVNSIVNTIIKPTMNDSEKIEAIIEYVINHLEYNYNIDTDYSLLEEYNNNSLKYALEGIGCCKNYTALTTALLRSANINGYEQKNDNHIWNIIELDEEYYYIDSTFIDTENTQKISQSPNFMTNEKDFLLEHNSILIPSSMYNKIHNKNLPTLEQQTPQKASFSTKNTLKTASVVAIVGIAIALNSAFMIKKERKTDKSKGTVK